jgi:dTDP-4-dehydro-6-deoxy-alpha-D-glucopyranose 2,3-dehydratase
MSVTENRVERPLKWLSGERRRQQNTVTTTSLPDSREWSLISGRIGHESGRFFEVVGLEWTDSHRQLVTGPFIDQPEVGILGFLTTRTNGAVSLLLDAKFEPGNVGNVHAAPSFQATKSNADCVHGGTPPTLSHLFLDDRGWHSGILQSEEGTRFVNKWNMNVVVKTDERIDEPTGMSWHTFNETQKLLHSSNSLNTDARSVLVTADWDTWLSGHVRHNTQQAMELTEAVRLSLAQSAAHDLIQEIDGLLDEWQSEHGFTSVLSPLQLEDNRVSSQSHGVATPTTVSHVQVKSDSRERDSWDQPLLKTSQTSEEILICTQTPTGLRFLFFPIAEVGLTRAELGNSVSSFDAARNGGLLNSEPRVQNILASSTKVVGITQSDEGGRFDQQIVEYALHYLRDTTEAKAVFHGGVWLSLAEIQELVTRSGYFTNEARTAISLVLGMF